MSDTGPHSLGSSSMPGDGRRLLPQWIGQPPIRVTGVGNVTGVWAWNPWTMAALGLGLQAPLLR